MATEIQVTTRWPIELRHAPITVFAVDDTRAPEPRAFPAEVTLHVFKWNTVVVRGFLLGTAVGDCVLETKRGRLLGITTPGKEVHADRRA